MRNYLIFSLYLLVSTCFGNATKIISRSSRKFQKALPTQSIEVDKTLDVVSRRIGITSNSPYVTSSQDLISLENAEEDLQVKTFGSMSQDLRLIFTNLKDTEEIEINVYSKYPEGIFYLNKLTDNRNNLEKNSKAISLVQSKRDVGYILRDHEIYKIKKTEASVAVCTVSKSELMGLAFDPDVGSISFHSEALPTFKPISILPILVSNFYTNQNALAASAYNHTTSLPPSTAGAGVHAATYESGIDPSIVSCWGISPAYYDPPTTSSWHSNTTFRCMTNAARGATFYHRRSWTFDSPDDQNFLINNAIQTVSISQDRQNWDIYHPYTASSGEFIVMDDFAYRFPYPVWTNPSGNWGWMYETNWQLYNAISVGNVLDSNFIHYTIDSNFYATMTRNPEQRYGGACGRPSNSTYSYCSSDREMPYVIAPGIAPYTVQGAKMMDPCVNHEFEAGTSYSAPTANGIAADIIGASSTMSGWPEKVRAVMILTAENVTGDYWNYNTDGADGSGVVNGSEGVSFAISHSEVAPLAAAAQKGIGVGYVNSANWNDDITYNIKIPSPKPVGKHLRLVLTWDSNPVVGGITNALSDLDLIWVGTITRWSSSYNGNVEVIDIPTIETPAGASYQATISKLLNRIPAESRTDFFYYTFAWEFVKDHAR